MKSEKAGLGWQKEEEGEMYFLGGGNKRRGIIFIIRPLAS